jgi:hypothetical protein
MPRLVSEHSFLGPAAAFTFLTPDLFDTSTLRSDSTGSQLFYAVEQEASCEEAIQALLPGRLAFDLKTGWGVPKQDTSRGLVNILASVSAGSDKRLFQIAFAHTQNLHSAGQLILLFYVHRERLHGHKLGNRPRKLKRGCARAVVGESMLGL